MAIADTLNSMKENLGNAYDALENKGATIPENKNLESLASTIETIVQGVDDGYADWGTIYYTNQYDSNEILKLDLTTQDQYKKLVYGNETVEIAKVSVNLSNMIGFRFGKMCKDASSTSGSFLGYSTKLQWVKGTENLETIGDGFLQGCSLLNCDLDLSNVKTIAFYFLKNCTSFNGNITFKNLKTINANFMEGCTAYSKPLTLPSSITSFAPGFMYNCNSFIGPLTVETNTSPTDNNSLATTTSTASMYVSGVTIEGEYAHVWGTNLPNRTNTPFRKLNAPEPPTPALLRLRQALADGTAETEFPIGTEIDDTWGGKNNPLIVAHYGTATVTSGGTKQGVYLFRKYIDPNAKAWGTATNNNYSTGSINAYLNDNSTYLYNCSQNLKDVVEEISVQYSRTASDVVSAKMWLMSPIEVGADWAQNSENFGTVWDYWKNVVVESGSSVPYDYSLEGRVGYDTSGTAKNWWLRTKKSSSQVRTVDSTGSLTSGASATSTTCGVRPACFIAVPSDEPEGSAIAQFKASVNAGTASTDFPIGTEIEDTYGGESNPLIVAQYLDSSNNSVYSGAEGAILIRKYAVAQSVYGSEDNYDTSTVKNYLSNDYYTGCSTDLQNAMNLISLPSSYGSNQLSTVQAKAFLMSENEIGSKGAVNWSTGNMFDYWKEKTGLSTPGAWNTANAGRIVKNTSGTNVECWLRGGYNSTYAFVVTATGAVTGAMPTGSKWVLPAHFIGKE